jgi:cell pole-organizing protein PopZ
LLQPILQGWLDDKLPEIIERLVRSEIARVLNSVAA